MSQSTSSAQPKLLFDFSGKSQQMEVAVMSTVRGLENTLRAFEQACTESGLQVHVLHLVPAISNHSHRAMEQSDWVRQVGYGFQRADEGGLQLDDAGRFHNVADGQIELMPFSSMADLFKAVYELNEADTPIKIVKIGDGLDGKGKYLVLIAGTGGWEDLNSWYGNQSGMGLHTPYMDRIKDAMAEAGIPEGATVNLVGHSQGGHAAMLLADDNDVTSQYKIGHVITFGSPGNVGYNPELDKGQYHNYLLDNDLLGTVMNSATERPEEIIGLGAAISPEATLLAIGLVGAVPGSYGSSRVESQKIGYAGYNDGEKCAVIIDGAEAHNSYDKSAVLQGKALPFSIDKWQVVGTYSAEGYHNFHRAIENTKSTDGFLDAGRNMLDLGGEIAKYGGSFAYAFGQNRVDTALVHAPIPVQRALDAAMDDLGHRLTTGPLPSEAAGNVVDGLARIGKAGVNVVTETGATLVESSQYMTSGLGSAAGEMTRTSGAAIVDLTKHSFDSGRQVMQGMDRATNDVWSGSLGGVEQIADGMQNAVDSAKTGNFRGATMELGSGIGRGSQEVMQGHVNAWGDFTKGIEQGLDTMASGTGSAAQQMVQGMTAAQSEFTQGMTETIHRQVEGYKEIESHMDDAMAGARDTYEGIIDFVL